ncbi:TonB-dependent receptor domain-containing protein [Hyphobacterium sp.]|uniref:TonB-dependent receptor domain-containing protein n=1 Tax=Hyphobacterium sp. TaxID=2004662 RepID=UPI003BAC7F54
MSSFWDRERLLRSTILAGFAAAGLTVTPAFAQDAVDEDEETEEAEEDEDLIIVTGSRIQRSEFSSISPIQTVSGEQAREVGLVNAAEILLAQSQSTGTQIDQSFIGFVLDNGPGSVQVNLRGLNPERTLVLVNGRRMSPAGIGGAPTTPDLTVIPGIIVDRFDLLLDGASSVYGSDAVAGVANVILRSDFEGFEFQYRREQPDGFGTENSYSGAWGINSDRGFAGFAFEYTTRERIQYQDRPFTARCQRNFEVQADGRILSQDVTALPGMGLNFGDCTLSLINRMSILGFGSVYWTPGQTNINNVPGLITYPVGDPRAHGIPGWSESSRGGQVADRDGDGLADFDFYDPFWNYNASQAAREADFIPEAQTYNIYTYGEHDIDWGSNTAVYYEALFANRQSYIRSQTPFFFPVVPGANPFNPCNSTVQDGDVGVNCVINFGANLGDINAQPILRVRGDRDEQSTDLDQFRFVGGVRGDLPLFRGWDYDIGGSYARSRGFQSFQGIHEQRLAESLNTTVYNPVTNTYSCGAPYSTGVTCVPVNLFNPQLYQEGGGYLQADEAAYLFSPATNMTVVEQTMVTGIFTGGLGTMFGMEVPLIFGFEWREDALESNADDVRARGLIQHRASDRGATGRRHLWEYFFETELTPISGRRFAEELTFNLSGRFTDESNYGSDFTYSVKGVYRPNDWLSFRGSYGTSYRAPNAREQFLAGATGFVTVADPCIVPNSMRQTDPNDPTREIIDPTQPDPRTQITLDNCRAAGLDPLSLGLQPNGRTSLGVSTEQLTGGAAGSLNPETSISQTFGIVTEQPWFDSFDLRFAATYFDIVVSDSIEEPSSAFIINDCYNDNPGLSSGFCNRITRNAQGFISLVDASFINIGTITAKGADFNMVFQDDWSIFGAAFGVTLDVRATRLNEQIFNVLGAIDDNAGETEAPNWTGNLRASVDRNDWRFSWFTRYIGGGEENNPGSNGVTCNTNDCTPVFYTPEYYVHNASITWTPNDWIINVGLENVFDEEPPLVDPAGVFSIRNFPLGVGYDIPGRRWFVGVTKRF